MHNYNLSRAKIRVNAMCKGLHTFRRNHSYLKVSVDRYDNEVGAISIVKVHCEDDTGQLPVRGLHWQVKVRARFSIFDR